MAETNKDSTHGIAIERLIAVEYENVSTKLRAQGLDRLGFASTRRSEWRATKSPVQGLREGEVASVRQWRLDELLADPEVLEAIVEVATGKLNVELLKRVLLFWVEVEPHVVEPGEIIDGLNLLLDQLLGDLSLMYKVSDELLVLLTDVLV